jgi:transposase
MTDPRLREIAQLNRHRHRLIDELQQVRNWLEHRSHLPRFEVRQLLSLQAFLDLQLTDTEKEISRLVNEDPALLLKLQVLMRIPGMGPVLALTLVCEMGDALNYDSAQQYAAQAGLNPCRHESGDQKGHTRISKAGNVWVRRAGWMPAGIAMTYNRPIKELSERLKEKKLESKQIRTAAMRKLVMQAYGVLKAHAQGKEPFYPESTNANTQAKAGKKKDPPFKFRPSPSRDKARRELESGTDGKTTPRKRKNRTTAQAGAQKAEELPCAA